MQLKVLNGKEMTWPQTHKHTHILWVSKVASLEASLLLPPHNLLVVATHVLLPPALLLLYAQLLLLPLLHLLVVNLLHATQLLLPTHEV